MHKCCQFKIILYAFKLIQLTSFKSKQSFEPSTQNEVSLGNFNTCKIIFDWQSFMQRIFVYPQFVLIGQLLLTGLGELKNRGRLRSDEYALQLSLRQRPIL